MRVCVWCGSEFEPEGKQVKCPDCRNHHVYTKEFIPYKTHDMRMSRPVARHALPRNHTSRP